MKNKIIILSGDPKSINAELIYKSWKKLNNSLKKRIFIISNYDLLKKQFKQLKYSTKIIKVNNTKTNLNRTDLKILNIKLNFKKAFDISTTERSKFVEKSLNIAHKLGLKKDISGVINCSIDKKLLNKKRIGVTEYLAKKCNLSNNSEVMIIRNDKLSVCPLTTHVDIKQVSRKINIPLILKKVNTINLWFKKSFKKKPKIGILGLNPHNAELRKNSEEVKYIIPAIIKLKKIGVNISGPFIADTIFIKNYKNFDIIIGMYHDQILTPFKTLFGFNAINLTLGLKYLRVSPDHGVAVDLIGKNKSDTTSLLNCIKFVNKFGK
jgi:4-hydroxy-L-threonine phosphate dehydrogenase PdxA